MNIGILSRGAQLYSTQSLLRAGNSRGHNMHLIDITRCALLVRKGVARIYYDNRRLNYLDAIIPRIGASLTSLGAAVIKQFELMDVFTVARSQGLLQSRNKLHCLQKLSQSGIDSPKTVFAGPGQDVAHLIRLLGGLPVVIKLLESTHGVGVILAESMRSAEATIEAFQKIRGRVILQEFIRESQGSDIRALVVAGEVVAVMKRQAKEGEFRSNLHRGASSERSVLSEQEQQMVKKVVKIMGLDVAGVDMLRSQRGPLIMEVNASPGLEGIENTTGVDVAGKIIEFIEKRVVELHNYQLYLKRSGD